MPLRKALVAEPNKTWLGIEQRYLKGICNCNQIDTAFSSYEVKSKVTRKNLYDLYLLDISCADVGGYIKEIHPEARIIITTITLDNRLKEMATKSEQKIYEKGAPELKEYLRRLA